MQVVAVRCGCCCTEHHSHHGMAIRIDDVGTARVFVVTVACCSCVRCGFILISCASYIASAKHELRLPLIVHRVDRVVDRSSIVMAAGAYIIG
eukprot:scaffold579178_cov138-Attheya_sp.AAC.2